MTSIIDLNNIEGEHYQMNVRNKISKQSTWYAKRPDDKSLVVPNLEVDDGGEKFLRLVFE